MVLLKDGIPLAIYPVSTSRFGLGDQPGTRQTPTGVLEVASKIGEGAPLGEVFKSRSATGEIVRADSPGRDPIVTRILWLRGLESRNQNAYERFIYIHGTPEERNIGRPASYGCVRMRSCDVVRLFDEIGIGARVYILNEPLVAAAAPHIVPEAIIPPMPTPLPAPAMAYGAPANGQAQVAVSVTAPSR